MLHLLPLTSDLEGFSDSRFSPLAQLDLQLQTQLSNRWNVNLSYFAQYEYNEDDLYTDNIALFVGGTWGTFSVGNLDGYVRDQTRRARGAGNSDISFDDNLGGLEEWGAGYSGRFGPMIFTGVVDDDSNFDVVATFQRPIDDTDYRFSLRYNNAEYLSADESTLFDTQGVSLIGELVYGSNTLNIGVGYENLDSQNYSVDRWYVSAGATRKKGVLTWSLDGLYGEIDGQSAAAASLGASYDIARGTSLNLGVNYSEADISVDNINLVFEDGVSGQISLRYSF